MNYLIQNLISFNIINLVIILDSLLAQYRLKIITLQLMVFTIIKEIAQITEITMNLDYRIQLFHENHNDLREDNAKYSQLYSQYARHE